MISPSHQNGVTDSLDIGNGATLDAADALATGPDSAAPANTGAGQLYVPGATAGPVEMVTSAAKTVPQTHLVINAQYGPALVALNDGIAADVATYNGYVSAINTAISYYESIITTPITITLNFDWSQVDGHALGSGLGESESSYSDVTYSQLYNAFKALSNPSAVQKAALASLPSSDPTGGGQFVIDTAEAQALGLTAALGITVNGSTVQGYVGLGSTFDYGWTQTSIGASQYDAVGVLEHEISEDLGRVDFGGGSDEYSLLDLFRYTAAGGGETGAAFGSSAGARDQPFVSGYSASALSYFSYDGNTITNEYDTPMEVRQGADIADWTQSVSGDSYGYGTNGEAGLVTTTDQEELQVLGYAVTCFLAGTRIATDRGDVPVQDLAISDRVLTVSGAARPIRWIGARSFSGRFVARNAGVRPILFRAGSLADRVPRRDLYVSPRHAMFLDGLLIEASDLVNGVSILPAEPMARVDYFHVELDDHDVILAEGAATETFVDDDSRGMFHNADDHAARYPGAARRPALYCAPRVAEGFALAAVRQRLDERAGVRRPVGQAPLRGQVDRVGTWLIEGWAQNPAHPEAPVCLDILLAGAVIAQTLANQPRPDLRLAGLGSGRHAFSVRVPQALSAAQRASIAVRRSSDGATLPRGAPRAMVA